MNNTYFSSSFISKEEYQTQKAWGLLVSINLYRCNFNKLTNPLVLKKFALELCKKIKMEAEGKPIVKKFGQGDIEGYSAILFIKTSSITIHCDDKINQRVFIDIFSCKYFNGEKALKFSKNFFQAKKAKSWYLLRT